MSKVCVDNKQYRKWPLGRKQKVQIRKLEQLTLTREMKSEKGQGCWQEMHIMRQQCVAGER